MIEGTEAQKEIERVRGVIGRLNDSLAVLASVGVMVEIEVNLVQQIDNPVERNVISAQFALLL